MAMFKIKIEFCIIYASSESTARKSPSHPAQKKKTGVGMAGFEAMVTLCDRLQHMQVFLRTTLMCTIAMCRP